MADGIKISALTEATDAQTVDGNLLETAVVDSSSSTGFSSKKTPISRLAKYVLDKYTGLSLGGVTRTVKTAIDALQTDVDKKADADGEYDNLIVGTSKQLLSDSYTEDFTPYKFRRSPYNDRLSESIVGASVAWNQLVNTSDTSITVPSGHKYLSRISGTDALGASTGTEISVAGTDNVHDLTQMFGTTVADALYAMGADGVALFRSWYPSPYYAYSAPTLERVSGLEAHEMVGFNQWDEEWELGSINTSSGAKQNSTITIRNKNDIRVLPNTEYYFRIDASSNTIAYYYREDLSFISASGGRQNKVFTTPSDCAWLRFVSNETVNHDICINLSDPTRNGTYKPYSKHAYALDASLTLRGLIKYDTTKGFYADGDTYAPDGTVDRRFVQVVLTGAESWSLEGSQSDRDNNPTSRFYIAKNDILKPSGNASTRDYIGHMISTVPTLKGGYVMQFGMTGIEMGVTGYQGAGDSNYLYIIVNNTLNTTITTVNALKSWLASHPLEVVYELATPTTESAEPFEAIQITDGTEEYVSDCLAPVGHESKYYANLRSKIEGLPTDFSAIICATEATNKASRNYAVGDYLIYGNTLYKVTNAIAANAALTVGTNISATTIMAEIKALQ